MIAEAAPGGLIVASAFVFAAEIAFDFRTNDKVSGLIMAFEVGALLTMMLKKWLFRYPPTLPH